ncbi:MAG: tetratricopeptide repeat protein [Clostridiaceae bacterium]
MKKHLIFLSLCFLILFSFTACSESKPNKSSEEARATEQAAQEKTAELNKKSQDGYDLFFAGKYDDAIAAENSVIKEDPLFFKAYYIKGITQCYAGNYEEGSKNIDKALELSPNDYMARFNKALSLELYRHYDEALVWYDKSLEISKGEWSYYGIASIYGRRGDTENTVKYLRLAFEINPDIKNEARNEADFNLVKHSKEFKEMLGE